MSGTTIAIGIILVLIIAGIGIGAIAGYTHYVNNLNYNKEAGDYFNQADQATTPQMKIYYLDQYATGIQKLGLDKGVNSVLNSERPNAQNANTWRQLQDLRAEVVRLNSTDVNSFGYAPLYQKVQWTDFCYFPDGAFEQAYQLNHGGWGVALFPPDQHNDCVKPTSTNKS